MTDSLRYLIVEPSGAIRVITGVLDTKDALHLLNDDFEVLQPASKPDFIMLVAENGKSKGFQPNWGATRTMRSILRPDDFIVGRVIIAGPPDPSGDPTDVSPELETEVRKRVEQR